MSRGGSPFVLLALAVGLSGCDRSDPSTPPVLHYGEDICELCGMIVSDERFVGALVVEEEPGRITKPVFDDIGCLLTQESELDPDVIRARYVSSAVTGDWIPFESALFLYSPLLPTPMASGAAAASGPEELASLIELHGGTVLDAAELRRRHDAGSLVTGEG